MMTSFCSSVRAFLCSMSWRRPRFECVLHSSTHYTRGQLFLTFPKKRRPLQHGCDRRSRCTSERVWLHCQEKLQKTTSTAKKKSFVGGRAMERCPRRLVTALSVNVRSSSVNTQAFAYPDSLHGTQDSTERDGVIQTRYWRFFFFHFYFVLVLRLCHKKKKKRTSCAVEYFVNMGVEYVVNMDVCQRPSDVVASCMVFKWSFTTTVLFRSVGPLSWRQRPWLRHASL